MSESVKKGRYDYLKANTDIERLWAILVQQRREAIAYRERMHAAMRGMQAPSRSVGIR